MYNYRWTSRRSPEEKKISKELLKSSQHHLFLLDNYEAFVKSKWDFCLSFFFSRTKRHTKSKISLLFKFQQRAYQSLKQFSDFLNFSAFFLIWGREIRELSL